MTTGKIEKNEIYYAYQDMVAQVISDLNDGEMDLDYLYDTLQNNETLDHAYQVGDDPWEAAQRIISDERVGYVQVEGVGEVPERTYRRIMRSA